MATANPNAILDKFVSVGGIKTHYLEAGEGGKTLFLVHGGGSFSCAEISWMSLMKALQRSDNTSGKKVHVFAVDQLGFGFTDMPSNPNYSLRARAEHLVEFLRKMVKPGEKVTLLGNSQGGWIVTYITITYPELVEKLVLVDSGSTAFEMGDEFPQDYTKFLDYKPSLDNARKHLRGILKNEQALTNQLVKRVYEISVRNYETSLKREEVTTKSPSARNENTSIGGIHISRLVDKIKVPTLIIWGKQDTDAAVVENGFQLFKRMRNADMYIFGESAHWPFNDFPDRFAKLLADFMMV